MKINIKNLTDFIKKSTLNHTIDSIQITFNEKTAIAKMVTPARNAVTILNVENNILWDIPKKDVVVFNFSEPNTNLIPFLNLIEDEFVDVKVSDNKITLKQGNLKSNIHFCSSIAVSTFDADGPKQNLEYFYTFELSDDFVKDFQKIKKIGNRFGKVYFTVEDNKFYIETGDKTSSAENNLRFELADVKCDDLTLLFDYKNVVNLFSVIDSNSEYKISFSYVKEQKLGMLFLERNDSSEKYYLMSVIE